ncbi:MAG: 50S ribosomal protein L32 [Candidatus Bipolaricaulota bacterium]
MAVPKFRTSKSKKRKRQGGNKPVINVNAKECPHCHELKMPHRVCMNCGYYKGEEIVEIASDEEE